MKHRKNVVGAASGYTYRWVAILCHEQSPARTTDCKKVLASSPQYSSYRSN